MNAVALIEFHDAVVASVSLQMSGVIQVGLSHVSVYLSESPDTYGVWSFEGTLLCEGVRQAAVNVTLPLDPADAVADCEILNHDGRRASLSDVSVSIDNARLQLTWCLSSNAIVCTAERITLRLEKRERLETWVGPLASGREP